MILSSYPQPPQLHGLETVHRHSVERWPDSWWSSLRKSHHGGSAVIILNGFVVEGNSTLSFTILSAVSSSGAFYCEVIDHRSPCQTQACQPFTPSLQNCGEFIWLFRNHPGSGVLLGQHRAGCGHIYETLVHVYFIFYISVSFLYLTIWTHLKIEVQTAMRREKPDKPHCLGVGIFTVKIRSSIKPSEKPLLLDLQ